MSRSGRFAFCVILPVFLATGRMSAPGADTLILSNGESQSVTVLGYADGDVRFLSRDGKTNSLPIRNVRRIDIDRGVPAAPPVAPEPVARAIKGDELRRNTNKCYIVFSHPRTDKYGTVWIHLRRKQEYEEKKGAFNVSGIRYDPVVSTIFDRNGQMFFEAEPGKYEVSLSLEPDGGRQLRKTGKMELKAGEMMDYSFPLR